MATIRDYCAIHIARIASHERFLVLVVLAKSSAEGLEKKAERVKAMFCGSEL